MDRQASSMQSTLGGAATTRQVLTGDALLQARVKAALDNVKLALQDFKEELQASTKLGDEVAGVRSDLTALRGLWEQHAVDSSNKLATKLESTLSSLLSPILKELSTTSTFLSSSLASVSTSVTDGEARTVNLLQTHFSSLRATQSGVTEAVRALESHLKVELDKVKSEVKSSFDQGSAALEKKLEELEKGVGEILERQKLIVEQTDAAKVNAGELSALKSMLECAEQERQQDRQNFTKELVSLSSTLAPLAACLPQLTALLRSGDRSRTSSHGSTSLPPSAQPGQMQRAPSSAAGQSFGAGDSLGSSNGRKSAARRSSSSESDSRRSASHRSKTQSPPKPARRQEAPSVSKNHAPSSSAPGGTYTRSFTTPPEAQSADQQQLSTFDSLSPPFGPSTQSLLHERSPSPATRASMEIVHAAVASVSYLTAPASSSAPAKMVGSASMRAAGGGEGARRKRQKREIAQSSSDDELDKKEEPVEKRMRELGDEEEPDTQ